MLDQLSSIGERERLSRNPYFQAAQQPSTKEKFLSGLASGLNRFAEMKMQQMESANRAKGWESLGLRPDVAQFVSQQSPDFQKDFFSRLEGLNLSNQPSEQLEVKEKISPSGQKTISEGVRLSPSKEVLKQQAELKKQKAEQFKATKEFRHDLIQSRKDARGDLKDLSRLEDLSKSGKLNSPGWIEFLHNSGLDIPALMSPESEEFQKIQQSFLKRAKQYFGSRVSNFEVEQFLKTIPSLSQSPEGRQRVIANLKNLARGAEEYYKTYEEIIKENNGIPPYDIEEEIERRIDPKIERLADKFKKDLEKPVPAGQNKFITGLGSVAGKAVGNLGKGLAGAAAGGIAGSAIGGLGAIPGAAIGGLAGLSGLGLKSFL
jgi:hypothetical protein